MDRGHQIFPRGERYLNNFDNIFKEEPMAVKKEDIAKAVLDMGGVVMFVPCDFCDELPCVCECVVCESTKGCKCTT